MNERDPINEWKNSIKDTLLTAVMMAVLFVLVMGLIAPCFGPMIKRWLLRGYVAYPDYVAIVDKKMRFVWIALWIICALDWWFMFVYCPANCGKP